MEPAKRITPPIWMTAPETGAVLAALRQGGAQVRFVGGCVRDALLGRPVKDIDLATPEAPQTVMARLAAADLRALPTGIDHGTVTAVSGSRHFEVTTLRRDEETFGRHARVAFTDDWAEDAARRDFTMNALYADPDGVIYDPTGGLSDLAAGIVRFVGEPARRIEEDALRLLRYFRFHAHYGRGAADPAALEAAAAAAPRLARLSGERLWAETHRLLAAPDPTPALGLMRDRGVLAHLLPDATPDLAALARLMEMERARGEADPVRRLALLLPGRAVDPLASRFKLSNAERERLLRLTGTETVPDRFDRAMRVLIYRQGQALMRDRALLGAARSGGAQGRSLAELVSEIEAWRAPEFPLRGADALALGMPPGPEVGRALRALEDRWIDGDFAASREELLADLRRAAGRSGATDSRP